MKDPNKIYNRILDIIGFLATLGFVICQITGVLQVSWWYILFPALLPGFFHVDEEESYNEDDDENTRTNNYKMA